MTKPVGKPSARDDDGALLPGPIAILLIPDFTAISLFSILEPLRIANRYVARPYRWTLISLDGAPVPDRNSVKIAVDAPLGTLGRVGTLMVIADALPPRRIERPILSVLRRLAKAGATVGGTDTGPLLLARAGLLEGRTATAHWEVLKAFREAHPQVTVTERLFEYDRGRCTCAGGSAGIDLVLTEIETSFGRQLAERVAEHCMHGEPRPAGHAQRVLLPEMVRRTGRELTQAIRIFERDPSRPTKIDSVANQVGISRRKLHRIFTDELATSPARFRRKIRLEHARRMLLEDNALVTDVAVATGFQSRAHFSRCYSKQFGHPPSHDKR